MSMTRREWIVTAGALTLGGLLGTSPATARMQDAPKPAGNRKRSIRIAHLTDIHVQPERAAGLGMETCLKHVQQQTDKPTLILTGGDLIMDSFDHDAARTKLQWELFTKVLKDSCGLPVRHTLGNHDTWGWNKKKSKTTGDEPMWGKKWACEQLSMPKPYHSHDQSGWHFIHLDSVSPDGEGYCGKLDDEQMDWLKADLAKTDAKTPVLVISHIPIVSVAPAINGKEDPKLVDHKIGGGVMHRDAIQLKNLFLKHRNVKVCLSGHLHLNERIDFNGVTYLCNGAVSGAWWRGKNAETANGYALIDLFDDGTFENRYVEYEWKVVEA